VLEDLKRAGKLKDIGVSNFGIPHLSRLAESSREPPSVNQIELHPWLQWRPLVAHCREKGVLLQAYSPLAKASRLDEPLLATVAQRLAGRAGERGEGERGISPAQVLVAYSLRKEFIALPKSVDPGRQRSNWLAQQLAPLLDERDLAELDQLDEYFVTGWNPINDAEV
jgi:diketogulonate reductase-like aldo/keto reductase